MSHHYINPSDEYRDCESCDGSGYATGCTETDRLRGDLWACLLCDGTGKLGDPDAKPEIEVWEYFMEGKSIGYFWNEHGTDEMCGKPNGINSMSAFVSEAEALEAARKALTQR